MRRRRPRRRGEREELTQLEAQALSRLRQLPPDVVEVFNLVAIAMTTDDPTPYRTTADARAALLEVLYAMRPMVPARLHDGVDYWIEVWQGIGKPRRGTP
jgi:hypothetical protein